MGIKCGIVGLPNVGKSTLFNALTRAQIAAENYPFCTIDPNVGRGSVTLFDRCGNGVHSPAEQCDDAGPRQSACQHQYWQNANSGH